MRTRFVSCIIAVFCLSAYSQAETIRLGPQDDWFSVLSGSNLRPGDEVVLDEGTYTDPRRLSIRHRGSAQRPIVIRGTEGKRVIFRRPDAKQNSLNLEGAQHLVLRDFELTGGAAGIRISPRQEIHPTGIVLQNLHIHHIGGVAVTCNHTGGDYSAMVFRHNHIHHTSGHGEAFYLGGNRATAIFHESVVEGNYIHDLTGEHVSQGDGIELKQGSYGNRVFDNVIHDTNFPGIIVYGTAGRARNQISDNLIWNSGDHGIQAAADAVIEHNFIADVRASGIYSRTHQGAVPGNLSIRDNVVMRSHGAAIRIIPPSDERSAFPYSGPIAVTNNVLFSDPSVPAFRLHREGDVKVSGNIVLHGEKSAQVTTYDVELPRLENHPAWRYLDRAEVTARFLPVDARDNAEQADSTN